VPAIVAPDGLDVADFAPAARRLLARADRVPTPETRYPARLLARAGLDPDAAAPVAALGDGIDAGAYCLRFDPVALRADMTSLMVLDARAFDLDETEARALFDTVAALAGGAGLDLAYAAPSRWYARASEPLDVTCVSLADAAGLMAHKVLPSGSDARAVKTLMNEIQMALHDHPVNEARSARGALPVNSVWPWGGGDRVGTPVIGASTMRALPEDALARGIAVAAERQLEAVMGDADLALSRTTLLALERVDPAQLSTCLAAAGARGFELSLTDAVYSYRPRHRLRVWRRAV